ENIAYWKNTLQDYKRLDILTEERYDYQTSKVYTDEFLEALVTKSEKDQIEVRHLFLAAYLYAISLLSPEKDITIGIVSHRRPIAEDGDKLLGCFLNTLPFRYNVNTDKKTWVSFIKSVASASQELRSKDRLSLLEIAKLHKESSDRNPFFDVIFSYMDFYVVNELLESSAFENHIEATELESLGVSGFERTNTYLDFTTNMTNNQLIVSANQTRGFKSGLTVDNILEYFNNFLHNYLYHGTEIINNRKLLSQEEEERLIYSFNNTQIEVLLQETIVEIFETQVKTTPNSLAIVDDNRKLTYVELDKKSNQLAHYLRKNGVYEGSLVPICLERSLEFVVGIMAVLKAGGAYVPIDPSYPQARIDFILEDTSAKIILTQRLLASIFLKTSDEQQVVYLDGLEISKEEPKTVVETNSLSTSLAYIIYTSGTTGSPKGVMISNKNLRNLIAWHQRAYELKNTSKALLFSGISFDASVWELFPYLLSGGCIYPVEESIRLNPDYIVGFINKNKITHAYIPTAFYPSIKNVKTPLKGVKLLLGGEALKMSELPENVEIYNNYGPTENTVVSTYHKVTELNGKILIGKPIDNTQAYILNADLQLVPIGVSGELCLSGKSLSSGYLNRKELTAEKFVAHPFKEDERLYKTGDLARWLPDGNIEFIGRKDNQIKIRGYRVELGEIESALEQLDNVQQSVVIVRENEIGIKELIAYITVINEVEVDNLKSALYELLPEYMVPKIYVKLQSFPLTPNGKIDRKGLPDPDTSAYTTAAYIAPKTQEELQLVTIWQELLHIEKIGIHDNFFELGGHSVLAIQLVSHVQSKFRVAFNVKDVFDAPTLSEMAVTILRGKSLEVTPIVVSDRPKYIPLSYAQERLWFIDQLQGSVAYHIPSVLRLKNSLKSTTLKKAVRALIKRHESLRTIFKEENGNVYQEIKNYEDFSVDYVEMLGSEMSLETFINEETMRPFDLSNDYMLRITLIEDTDESQVLILVIHHIASDGWSTPILINELQALYKEYTTGLKANLPILPIQYADYSIWQRNHLSGKALEEKLSYWREILQNSTPLELPIDFARPAVQSTEGKIYGFYLNKAIAGKLDEVAKGHGATLFMTLLSIYKVLLYRYTGQTDISVGTPIANRGQQEIQGLIGFFVNTIVLRDEIHSKSSFIDLLAQVKETCLTGYDHQDVPFEKIVDDLLLDRDQSRTPLFQTFFVFQKEEETLEVGLGDNPVTVEESVHATAKFDLTFSLTETPNGIYVAVEYVTALFKEETIARMARHFVNIAESVAYDTTQAIEAIEMLDAFEKNSLLHDLNQTETDYPKDKNVVVLFEEQAKATPNLIAVKFEGESLTYQQLNERANQLANYLVANSISQGDQVVFYMNRGIDYLVGMLGVWKVGACFIPLSTDFPMERNQQILSEANRGIVLSTNDLQESIQGLTEGKNILYVNVSESDKYSTENINISLSGDMVSYIIFTSGSTGKPKGAMLEHQGMLNHLYAKINDFNINESSNIAQTATQVFDVSIWQYMVALLVGGTTTVLVGDDAWDPKRLLSNVEKEEITVLESVPAHFSILLDYIESEATKPNLSSLVMLMMNGEGLPPAYCERWFKLYPEIAMSNVYGPTECSDDITHYIFNEMSKDWTGYVPIGKPIQNMKMYIVDEDIQLVPKGIIGELCASGDGVGQGYLGREALTAEKFIDNPFESGTKLYKTGDLVKWLPDGTIEFIGRKDAQVKISGNRIELGEIEVVIQEAPQVILGAVLVKDEGNTGKRLVGYIEVNESYTKEDLNEYLEARLPAHMIPSIFIEMEAMPLMPSGKIDRKALPHVDISGLLQENYIAPRNELESGLATLWENLLNIPKIGINDNFFELGGHSLLAIRLVSHIKSEFRVIVSVRDIFATPTIASLVETIKNATVSNVPEIVVRERPAHIPLSYAQERLWFIDKLHGSNAFHIPGVLRLKGEFNIKLFTKAIKVLVKRHESLRTIFKDYEGVGYQYIMGKDEYEVTYIPELPKKETITKLIDDTIFKAFDLAKDYMLRTVVVKESPTNHVLILVVHHIASDGWSLPILVKELEVTYQSLLKGEEVLLDPLPVQYADYSIWQREYLSGDVLKMKLAYWLEKLKGAAVLELPTDFPRPEVQSMEGSMHHFSINKELLDGLHELSKDNDATLFMTLLSIYKVLLYRYTGQTDISVGTPIANREQLEISKLIGFFANTIVLRDTFTSDVPFINLLAQVKQTCLESYTYQDVPFERIVDHLGIERDQSRSTLFQTEFVFQNNEKVSGMNLGKSELEMLQTEHTSSQFDILMNVAETPFGLAIGFEYATTLFKKETIVQMALHFEQLIRSILKDANQSISSLEIFTADTKQQLLETFNTTKVVYEKEQTVVDLFEAQVQKHPNAVALIHENKTLTYKELNEKSNQLAQYLRSEYDIKSNDLVGVMMSRSEWVIISILGILKAGAAYVPIDIGFPESRKQFIVEESSLKVLIINSDSLFDVLEFNTKIISIDIEFDSFSEDETRKTNLEIKRSFSDLAYVIYTSGSTGDPKGVMVGHKSFTNMVLDHSRRFEITEKDCVSQFTSFSFDVSASEIFMSLISGSCLLMLNKSFIEDGELFVSYLKEKNVTIAHIPPSYLISLDVQKLAFVKVLVVGGESPNLDVILECAKNSDVYNAYGPTECTVCSTIYKVEPNAIYNSQLPIGKPITNTQVYILNEEEQIVPIGVVGELCIGGYGLAQGYLNRPELTAEKFIPNPFKDGERLYKTGDLAKWNSDGNLEFIGRKDYQVKIRGYRIELGEIESALEQLDNVQQSVVIVRENEIGIKELIAYITVINEV
ncbi:non-ribosomal peptide synthetase, partial [Snuella sedimenti]